MYTVVVATGTRAEYGLLRPVLQKLAKQAGVTTKLWVTGAHLSQRYGYTINEITNDKQPVHKKIDILQPEVPATRQGTALLVQRALGQYLAAFEEEPYPDAVLLLGDRYEMFALAQAAALLNIPVVHISGGDVTHGADDDWFRHCITKMAKLHFPSTELYRQRVLRMGEQPAMVHNVGALGDENIRNMQLLSRQELAADVGQALLGEYALVTFHPETAGDILPTAQAEALLGAVQANPQLFYLFTAANADAGGEELNRMIQDYCALHSNAMLVQSLGVLRYLSAMKYASLVLGNSSSGVVETPSFGVPTVNIGNRQAGRIQCDNVLHCEATQPAITAAMQKAVSPAFVAVARATKSPYNGGETSAKIVEILMQTLHSGTLAPPKLFYDGEAEV